MIVLLASQIAGAQEPLPVSAQRLRPSSSAGGLLWTEAPSRGGGADPSGRALLHYTGAPLVYLSEEGDKTAIVRDIFELDLAASAGARGLRAGLLLPVYLFAAGDGYQTAGVGDLGLDGRWTFLQRGVSLGLYGRASLPTALIDAPLAARALTYELGLMLDGELGPVLLVADLGSGGMPRRTLGDLTLDDELSARVAAALSLGQSLSVSLEAAARLAYSAPPTAPGASYAEWLAGAQTPLGRGWSMMFGAGRGLTAGIGAPTARLLAGLQLQPAPRAALPEGEDPTDIDSDGILDVHDRCKLEPEDPDDALDTDGCPDPEVRVEIVLLVEGDKPPPVAAIALSPGASPEGSAYRSLVLLPGRYTASGSAAGYLPQSVEREITSSERIEIHLMPDPKARIAISREEIAPVDPPSLDPASRRLDAPSLETIAQIAAVMLDYPRLAALQIAAPTAEELSQAREALIAAGLPADRLSITDTPGPWTFTVLWR